MKKNLIQLEAELFLARLAFTKKPIEEFQKVIDDLESQIANYSEEEESSQEQKQEEVKEVKKKELTLKPPVKPKASAPKAPVKPKAPAPQAPAAPEAPSQPEESTQSLPTSEESTEKLQHEVTNSQTKTAQNEQNL